MASVSYGYFGEVGEVRLKKEIRTVFRCLCPHERNGDNIDVRSSKVHFHHCIVPTLGQNEPLPAVWPPQCRCTPRGAFCWDSPLSITAPITAQLGDFFKTFISLSVC